MVLCEGSFVMSTVASLMMNGVCCLWQMEEENERQMQQREAIRQDIRVEYERQRQIEHEIWMQRQQGEYHLHEPSGGSGGGGPHQTYKWSTQDSPLAHTELRRRKLMEDKQRLSRASQESLCDDDPQPPLIQRPTSPISRQPIKKRKIRLASPIRRDHMKLMDDDRNNEDDPCVWTVGPKSTCECSDMSSLMDLALENDDDDDGDGDRSNVMQSDNAYYGPTAEDECSSMGHEEITSLVDVALH
jgi:hypothetical protein